MKFSIQLLFTVCIYTLALALSRADSTPAAAANPPASSPSHLSLTNFNLNPSNDSAQPSLNDSLFKKAPDLSDSWESAPEIPTSTPEPRRQQLTPRELAAFQEKRAKESNWLYYGYEEAMRLNSTSPRTEISKSDDLSLQDPSDKYMLGMTGTSGSPTPYHTGATNPGKNNTTLRDDPSLKTDDKKTKPSLFQSGLLKPFITPLNSSEIESLHGSYGEAAPLNPNSSKMTFLQGNKDNQDTDDLTLETPGLTAAKNDPLSSMDSSLDTLPDEPLSHAQAHQDFFASSELPVASSALQLQNQQKISMSPPEPLRVAPPVVISPLLLMAPEPPAKPDSNRPSPVRPRVADPRDFLNR